jgi:hypothetical protein
MVMQWRPVARPPVSDVALATAGIDFLWVRGRLGFRSPKLGMAKDAMQGGKPLTASIMNRNCICAVP